jgi:hypothetical protein
MRPTAILLAFIICNFATLFNGTNDILLTVFASNNSISNHTNPSNDSLIKNTSRHDASCTNFLSVSCRLPSCDIQPMQKGCPLQATMANSTLINNTLRQLQNH